MAQTVLGLVHLGASMVGPTLPAAARPACRWIGIGILVAGAILLLAGAASLGRNLTPLPRPRPDAELVRTGAYRVVRHPIYTGVILAAAGWTLLLGRWLGLATLLMVWAFFDAKANREEAWLVERFPDYPSYRRDVAKLIPWLY